MGSNIGVDERRVFQSAKKEHGICICTPNPDIIEEYIRKEVARGNILGSFPPETAPNVHINRFGAIPKKFQPGKWRLITDLSYPEGSSGPCKVFTLVYISGPGGSNSTLIGKRGTHGEVDIKSAYRLVAVHPEDRKWLGMRWEGQIYVDAKLAFGLRSAPKILPS